MHERPYARLIAYGLAVLITAVTFAIRLLLRPWLGDAVPHMAFFPAVMIAAYYGGFRPGLLATFLGALAADVVFTEPHYALGIKSLNAMVALPLFLLVGLIISGLSESLHRSQRRIRASERGYAVTLASIGDGVIATDTHGRVIFLNASAEALTGWPLADAVGRPLAEVFRIVNEQTRRPVLAVTSDEWRVTSDQSARYSSLATRHSSLLLARDSREVPIDDCGAPIIDDRGAIVGAVLVFRDVTQRRQLEEAEAFRESEQRWRSLTEALPQLVWSAMPNGACDYFSTQWTEHTGIAEADLLGWRWLETLHPEDREPTRSFWLESVAGHHPYDVEYRVRRCDGEYRWFKTRGVPIRDGNGKIVKWFGTCTDITDLRQTQEALRSSEERFRGTFENAAVGIAHVDGNGRFLRVNEKYCTIVGYPHDELMQRTIRDLTHPDDPPLSMPRCWSVLRGEPPDRTLEQRYVRKDGSIVWVALSAALQRGPAGGPDYSISVIQDISERKELEAELRQAMETAEAGNRAKDEFLANVSHEIRTPMNAILGMTELALDTELTRDQRQCLKTVKSAADNLLVIINDLLDFAKIESGKLELDSADFSLRTAVGDTLQALAVRAHKKGLELISHVQPDVPDALVGDAGRLRQVLLNLVGNAIKFTDQGEVLVRVEVSDVWCLVFRNETPNTKYQIPNTVELRFSVTDTGIGIPRDQQERIFRAFEQEDTSTTRKYEGTGLGLTIASRLVALMGGQITVDSEPGRGSTFTFTARFDRQPHPPETIAAPPPVVLRDLPVLIVDDNATNRRILEECLRGWHMQPAAVGDGLAAVDALWGAAACGRPYALALLDARMPDVDGLALAAQIRQRAELSATRIILLTSGDRAGELAQCRTLRVDAHLLKPIQPDELLETIHRVMSRTQDDKVARWQGGKVTEDRASRVTLSPCHLATLSILVAEDNEFNSQLLEQLLERRGHRVRLASNGREALRLAQQGGFDLLLLDVHMPEMDGFQVVQAVREWERTAGGHLPIIALTARSRKEDREQCLAAGMDEFLAKPIQAADLWAAIDRVVAVRPPHPYPSPPEGERGRGEGGPALLDPQVLLAACGGDAAILERIGQAFRARLPDHLKTVQDALRDQDAPRLREAAHKLCGMVAAFSTLAGSVASELEDRAAQGQLEEARPLAARLETMADDLMRLVGGLSLEALHAQVRVGDTGRAAHP